MTVIHDQDGNGIDENNPLPIRIITSDAIIPVDDQNRLQTTIQTHNAVSVALSSTSNGTWIDTDGFDKIAVTLKNDASTASFATIDWSNDGVTVHGNETIIASSSSLSKAGMLDTKSRYTRINVVNGDATLAHTMSAWAYLKA